MLENTHCHTKLELCMVYFTIFFFETEVSNRCSKGTFKYLAGIRVVTALQEGPIFISSTEEILPVAMHSLVIV